ncbi:MAG: hypothetical protein WC975_16165 [Phycisphaerae bacterium]
MRIRCFALAVFLLLAACLSLHATETQPAKTTPDIQIEKLTILEPTQGRAKIIKPAESFYFMFRADKLDVPKIEVSLVNALCEQEKIQLVAVAPPVAMQVNHWVMLLKAPELTPNGVYDLVIDLGIGYQRVPRAIKVVDKFKKQFRFVHLSNMNIGDPTAPDFDGRLINEINLLDPEFIIATGDFTENTQPKNGPQNWQAVKKFLGRFNAPCYILCGDQDDPASFSPQIAPGFVGAFDYGPYHFFFLMDTSFHPIEQDQLQIKALVNDLANRQSLMTFLVANRDDLGLLDGLKSIGKDPAEVFNNGKVRYLLFGGSTDWDYKEYADKLSAAKLNNVAYIRTGQSSTCMKNGGPGFSRYRVFDVSESEVKYIYPDDQAATRSQSSIPTGSIRFFNLGPNDGTRKTERLTLLNTLNQSFPDCRVVFRLAGSDPKSVKIANARINQILVINAHQLMVLANVALPEKSSVQILATTDPAVEAQFQKLPVQVKISSSTKINFKPVETPTGLKFLAAGETVELTLLNTSNQGLKVNPQVTLDGQALIIQNPSLTQTKQVTAGVSEDGVDLPPGKAIKLSIKPVLRFIKSGKRLIEVYFLNDPLQRLTVFPVQVTVAGE